MTSCLLTAAVMLGWGLELSADPAAMAHDELYVLQADGSGAKRLGGLPGYRRLGNPVYSPDGSHIAVDAYNDERWESRLVILDDQGGNPVEVDTGLLPSWSPDGRKLAFTRLEPMLGWREVGYVELDGRRFHHVAPGSGIVWSPVGNYLVYRGQGVMLHELATRITTRPLADHPKYADSLEGGVAISPDGRRLCGRLLWDVGNKSHLLLLVDLVPNHPPSPPRAELPVRVLVKDRDIGSGFSWHPTQPRIVLSISYSVDDFQLYEVDPDQPDSLKRVVGQPTNRSNRAGTWHPDGRQLLFVSRGDAP